MVRGVRWVLGVCWASFVSPTCAIVTLCESTRGVCLVRPAVVLAAGYNKE